MVSWAMIDWRFPTALQMVLSLAAAAEQGIQCTSQQLALGLGANPSLVRKLLVPLNRAGLTTASLGKHGGVRLARPPGEITLDDVYRAITENKKLLAVRPNVPSVCVVSTNMAVYFGSLVDDVETAVQGVLGRRTLAQTLTQIRQIEARRLGGKSSSAVRVAVPVR